MNDLNHYRIKIIASDSVGKEVLKAKVFDIQDVKSKANKFNGAVLRDSFKIYIFKVNSKFLYVGITKQRISDRLRQGLTAVGEHGYHGYEWKQLAPVDNKKPSEWIDLYVYCIQNEERAEAVEAELVYLIRSKTGKWPEWQTEIHFHQSDNSELKLAQRIFDQI